MNTKRYWRKGDHARRNLEKYFQYFSQTTKLPCRKKLRRLKKWENEMIRCELRLDKIIAKQKDIPDIETMPPSYYRGVNVWDRDLPFAWRAPR
jgi:hypothetical protein